MKIYCAKCKNVFSATASADAQNIPCPKCGDAVPFPKDKLSPGAVIGDFAIERELGKGGIGEIFVARQISLDRQVALKVLQEKFINNKEYVDSLFREARAAAKISHPNIVQAFAVGEENGIFYFAMEYVRGETLKQILKDRSDNKLEITEASRIICEIAGALDVAWREQKLVHQDIKPDNIMLDNNGFAKLADLGLARIASSSDQIDEDANEVLGTPQYISPEQLTGIPTDVRSDIYSLGATYFQLVTGRFPYVADKVDDIAKMHVEGNLTPPKEINAEIPDEVNAIIVKMMARYPENRYQDPQALITDLNNFLRSSLSSNNGQDNNTSSTFNPLLQPNFGFKGETDGNKISGSSTTSVVPPSGKTIPKLNFGLRKEKEKPKAPATPETPVTPATDKPIPKLNLGIKEKEKPKDPVPPPVDSATPASSDSTAEAAEKKQKKNTSKDQPPEDSKDSTSKAEEEKSEPQSYWIRYKIQIISGIISIATVIILVTVGAITLYVMEGSEKLPEKLKPLSASIKESVDGKINNFKNNLEENAKRRAAENKAEQERLAAIEAAKPRPGYIEGIELALNIMRGEPNNPEKFLKEVEKFFDSYSPPRNDKEREAFRNLIKNYGAIDECTRVQPARELAHAQHAKETEESRKAAEMARQKEEEARVAIQRKATEDAQKVKAQEAAIQHQLAENKRVAQERHNKLEEELNAYYPALVDGFYQQVFRNDPEPLKKAIEVSKEVIIPAIMEIDGQKQLIAKLETFRNQLPSEAVKLRDFMAKLNELNQFDGIFLFQHGGKSYTVVQIAPGVISYRNDQNKRVDFDLNNASLRKQLFKVLDKRMKMQNTEFYFRLMSRQFPDGLEKLAPDSFWKQYIGIFVEAAQKK